MLVIDNLVRIAVAGGGMVLNAKGMTTDNLVRIAVAATNNNAKITLKNISGFTTDNLVRIAVAGKGNVVFDFTE